MNKNDFLDCKSIGYWSDFGGIEVKKIIYGINDFCVCVSGAWTSNKTAHKLKIHYGNKDTYIVLNGYKLKFSDCIRI